MGPPVILHPTRLENGFFCGKMEFEMNDNGEKMADSMESNMNDDQDWKVEMDALVDEWESGFSIVSEPAVQHSYSKRYQNNPIVQRTFDFSLAVIDFTEDLFEKKKFVIAQQLLKSGTSIGANSREAQNAESLADFVHKMKIALKEADETEYWLLLCTVSPHYPDCPGLIADLQHIHRILTKIVATSKQKLAK